MARPNEWPKDVGRQRPENITAHAKILLQEINIIESIARVKKTPAPYGAFLSILESTKALAHKVENESVDAILRKVNEQLNAVSLRLQAVETNTDPKRFVEAVKAATAGDVVVTAANLEDAEKLRQHESWVTTFGVDAKVKQRTYGVVIHGIPPKTMDLPASAREVAAALLVENQPRLAACPAEIVYLGWLLPERRRSPTSALVVAEFTNERAANTAIRCGLAWRSQNHACTRYIREARVQQCFRCQQYGHVKAHCARQMACAYCAENHDTTHCPHPRTRARRSAQCAAKITAPSHGRARGVRLTVDLLTPKQRRLHGALPNASRGGSGYSPQTRQTRASTPPGPHPT
ncbi:hypothetical protein ACJ73_01615 [Blastomyces percursus]|uniref:CCHC-type domain-containing protein n=1 Tax=Blastomyces percursus TaxID=1658174 RepID=A0A1J9RH84_9EURO|nr:hypothetical protein ACJ73_01615 [Blastomyces percursus]